MLTIFSRHSSFFLIHFMQQRGDFNKQTLSKPFNKKKNHMFFIKKFQTLSIFCLFFNLSISTSTPENYQDFMVSVPECPSLDVAFFKTLAEKSYYSSHSLLNLTREQKAVYDLFNYSTKTAQNLQTFNKLRYKWFKPRNPNSTIYTELKILTDQFPVKTDTDTRNPNCVGCVRSIPYTFLEHLHNEFYPLEYTLLLMLENQRLNKKYLELVKQHSFLEKFQNHPKYQTTTFKSEEAEFISELLSLDCDPHLSKENLPLHLALQLSGSQGTHIVKRLIERPDAYQYDLDKALGVTTNLESAQLLIDQGANTTAALLIQVNPANWSLWSKSNLRTANENESSVLMPILTLLLNHEASYTQTDKSEKNALNYCDDLLKSIGVPNCAIPHYIIGNALKKMIMQRIEKEKADRNALLRAKQDSADMILEEYKLFWYKILPSNKKTVEEKAAREALLRERETLANTEFRKQWKDFDAICEEMYQKQLSIQNN